MTKLPSLTVLWKKWTQNENDTSDVFLRENVFKLRNCEISKFSTFLCYHKFVIFHLSLCSELSLLVATRQNLLNWRLSSQNRLLCKLGKVLFSTLYSIIEHSLFFITWFFLFSNFYLFTQKSLCLLNHTRSLIPYFPAKVKVNMGVIVFYCVVLKQVKKKFETCFAENLDLVTKI